MAHLAYNLFSPSNGARQWVLLLEVLDLSDVFQGEQRAQAVNTGDVDHGLVPGIGNRSGWFIFALIAV